MALSLSFFSIESLKIILKMCSMSKSGKISRLSPLLTPYVMRTPKARFLCYSNKYPFTKLLYSTIKLPKIYEYLLRIGRFCAKIVAQECPYGIIRTYRLISHPATNRHGPSSVLIAAQGYLSTWRHLFQTVGNG